MPYTVRKGKLHFEPNVGNGPCRRRMVGQHGRRIVNGWHVTKGRWEQPAREGFSLVIVPDGPRAIGPREARQYPGVARAGGAGGPGTPKVSAFMVGTGTRAERRNAAKMARRVAFRAVAEG